MAQDKNGALVQAGATVRISRDRPIYCGTLARVIETHPFHVVTVEMFNGYRFRMSSRDMTVDTQSHTE